MESVQQVILVLAKQPVAGQVKTRLCPPLAVEQAAGLAEAFLHDTLANAARIDGAHVLLSHAPPEAAEWFAAQFPEMTCFPQTGGSLGERLVAAFETAWSRGYRRCVAIGADSPDLPPDFLRAAFEALRPGPESADVVLGPAEDGGYTLIGLRAAQPALFQDIPWSTGQVLDRTLAQADALGLRIHLLPEWYDVDTPADLERLRAHLHTASQEICPATRQKLKDLTPCLTTGLAALPLLRKQRGN
ncbi:MAG TPA: TIGR04282 family arsenosugar biosynthesis glycosyltransferase [Chthonomonadaceae bacterium]|nr:TIGR04282 family arsenosugar biosynthesis glycosyltransferase [Chthonomonadaceae bacterium]